MEDYKDQRKKAIKKTRFTCLVGIAIGVVLVGIGLLLRGKAQAFGVVIGLIGLVFMIAGVYVSFSEVQRIKRLFCSKCGYGYTIKWEESQRRNRTTEKKYMLTKRLIVHAKIAEMKRASQKNFLRLVLMKKVGLQIIMCKRK